MGSPLMQLHGTLVTFKGLCQGHPGFKLISYKGAELGYMLLININRNPYMGSPKTLSHLTLNDLEFQRQGHSDFKVLYLVKEQC